MTTGAAAAALAAALLLSACASTLKINVFLASGDGPTRSLQRVGCLGGVAGAAGGCAKRQMCVLKDKCVFVKRQMCVCKRQMCVYL